MKQQINLYLPELRQEKDWLNLKAMLMITGITAVTLVMASGVEFWNSFSLERQLEDTRNELNAARVRTNQLIDSFGVQSEDAELAAEVEKLEENLQGKRALLSFLDGRDLGNTEGFSEFLADLSRYHVPGLRLTGIELENGGKAVFLNGQVMLAENVPLYLQNLSKGRSFTGRSFETVRIEESFDPVSERTFMEFRVATTGAAN